MVYLSPLEQFDIIPIFSWWYWACVLTNFSVASCLCFLFFFIFFYLSVFNYEVMSHFIFLWSNSITFMFTFVFWIFKFFFVLVISITTENILQKKNNNLVIVFFIFLFILFCNLFGLIPFAHTTTGSFIFTFFISLSMIFGIIIMGYFFNQNSLFRSFLPGGTPGFIAPLLILIEIISYFSRVFSLSIRLFANMMSGHSLLKILIGFSFVSLTAGNFWTLFGFLPWFVVTVVTGLELAIAFLQAYAFVILICIYINETIKPH